MNKIDVTVIPYFDDNFSYLITSGKDEKRALVDCGDAGPVLDLLEAKGWKLDYLLATHSHYDHAGDIPALKTAFPEMTVLKAKGESRIATPGTELVEGDEIEFGDTKIRAISVPAHTNYCLSFLIDESVFVGDALFSGGCGRLFEGQADDLMKAMDKLSSLPDSTLVYFGHEYTAANLRFAISIEPDNEDLKAYISEVSEKMNKRERTTPSSIELEKKINPFFRIDEESVIHAIDPNRSMSRTERMAALRRRKDQF